MGSKKKWIANVLFLVLIIAMMVFAVLRNENPRLILRLLDRANGLYWAGGLILVLLFVCCESWILRLLLKNVEQAPARGHCILYSFIGFFFSCITPAAGGGQPAQVYFMRKDGIKPGVAAPLLVVVTICYKLVLVLYGILAWFVRPDELFLAHDGALAWCVAGWFLNVGSVTLLLMMIWLPKVVEAIVRFAMRIAARWFSYSRLDELYQKLERSIGEYHKVTECIQNNKKLLVGVVGISLLQRTLMFSVTWLVLLSFGIHTLKWIEVVIMQALVCLGTDLLPLPGGSGANEALFLLLFSGVCGELLDVPVLLTSRGISFYGLLLFSGLIFAFASIYFNKREKL